MEENKIDSKKLFAVLFYFGMLFIGSSLIVMIITQIVAKSSNLDSGMLVEIIADPDRPNYPKQYIQAYNLIMSLGNMVTYILVLAVVCFCMAKFLKADFLKLKHNWLFYLIYIPVAAFVFYFLTTLTDYIISIFEQSQSENQNQIVSLLENGGAVYMFIATVVCAPIVEELIYRTAIFDYLKKFPKYVAHILAAILFTIPHMLTTDFSDPLRWILISIPYLVSAILLGLIYEFSKRNFYATWFVHFVNNFIAFILVIWQMG